ncbi:RNA 2'-phosphotransferase [Ancylothrix sp. C2]|uniref:RNA 2'-phosphotransferase n=1 Tax=Ancylothrix sp. D3o TaxID=2953691 RepID=UPI0021BAFADF|nr:RNA 2'-phosphotransferase [Ancylothrix sp. D3o]MCT7948397.1 RNA 2'-phosphotransferase [Ancylothrix sp. D3o]
MLSESRLVKISKYLSYHLRHAPEKLGLKLDEGGWVPVLDLLESAKKDQFPISLEELKQVVDKDDKKRYSFDFTDKLIRANQGHSIKVDLQLKEALPPDILYHGTGQKTVESILHKGLSKMSRHHVHLSADMETAKKVGKRHGKPVILAVDAQTMYKAGYPFYCSDNGVWLVESVPPEYLQLI